MRTAHQENKKLRERIDELTEALSYERRERYKVDMQLANRIEQLKIARRVLKEIAGYKVEWYYQLAEDALHDMDELETTK